MIQVWYAFDQFVNALFGGQADETISSRCWRNRSNPAYGRAVRTINALVFWQNNHCRGAYAKYVARKSIPPAPDKG